MKRFLSIIFVLLCANSALAQEDRTEEQWKKNSEEKEVIVCADSITGFIHLDVSRKLHISDNIFIDNESDFVISKIDIWADYNGKNQYIPLTTGDNVYPGATKEIFETANGLRALRNRSLRVKVYGHLPCSNKQENRFKASLYGKSHDLFIKIDSY